MQTCGIELMPRSLGGVRAGPCVRAVHPAGGHCVRIRDPASRHCVRTEHYRGSLYGRVRPTC